MSAMPALRAVLAALAAIAPLGAQQPTPGPAPRERLALSPPFVADEGHAFRAPAPAGWTGDDLSSAASKLQLLEDDRPLGPAHALHADIRSSGGGRFSHWRDTVLFSTSDNSDPNSNGRHYSVEWHGRAGLGEDGYDPLPHFDPFAWLPGAGAGPGAPDSAARPPGDTDGEPVGPAPGLPEAGTPRVIWWYTIDALRADVPFAERDGVPVMPALSAFAREQAVAFDHAYANASFTKTSTASMFTGLWPQRHDVLHGVLPVWPDGGTLVFDLDRRFETLASWLARRGFDTWTHLYSIHVRRGDGVLGGYAHTDLDPDAAAPFTPPAGPLFVYEHVLGVHGPYRPSAAARARLGLPAPTHVDPAGTDWFERPLDAAAVAELKDGYLGEAVDADRQFARRIAWLHEAGLWDDALVIVTADHGEAFLEHGLTQHSTSLNEEMVRVPLFIRFPAGHPLAALAGQHFPQRISLVDVYPTLLELLHEPGPPYELDGRSLLPILRGTETDPHARDVLLRCSVTTSSPDGQGSALFVSEAIVSGTLKAQFGYRPCPSQDPARHPFARGDWIAELHDLVEDPGETHDLSAERPADFLRLQARARRACQPMFPRGGTRAPESADAPEAVGAELLEKLRALGYVR